jgi:hypothetical protein
MAIGDFKKDNKAIAAGLASALFNNIAFCRIGVYKVSGIIHADP